MNTTINTEASVKELKQGWLDDRQSQSLICVHCGKRFSRGRVYAYGDELLTCRAAADRHVKEAHGSAFEAILKAGKTATGLSEVQETVLQGLYNGSDDADIAKALGDKALSTVRSHRRNLRLKATEARFFLAAMELAEEWIRDESRFVDFGPDFPVHDERAVVTGDEAIAIKRTFMRPDGTLSRIPPKEKQKLVILRHLTELFEKGREYSDAEVRSLLGAVHEDHALLRRYLVDYRFIERDDEGRRYRRF
ncbi:MAG: DUF2087 domain-containing protein [Spirochaetota bacterium]